MMLLCLVLVVATGAVSYIWGRNDGYTNGYTIGFRKAANMVYPDIDWRSRPD